MNARRILLPVAVVVLTAAAGCGSRVAIEESASGNGSVLLITRDYGSITQSPSRRLSVVKGATAMRQLQATAKVATSYGGRYVTAIEGRSQDLAAGRDWLFYVDGVEAKRGAADTDLHAGQFVQWDLHDWRGLREDKAIVHAFPQPLRAYGVRLTCLAGARPACDTARRKLLAAGVVINGSAARATVTMIVGTAAAIVKSGKLPQLVESPATNGLLASFAKLGDGYELRTVDQHGRAATTLKAGSGLISAAGSGDAITWVVTGVDTRGTENAARRLTARDLNGAFAIATEGDRAVRLPMPGPASGAAP
ncbi:MAG: DUF4430 domain-containing protein [Actinobacteria bacterium]|nr:DUF4430 domain-containing protein [Actinomycetota bacterium]